MVCLCLIGASPAHFQPRPTPKSPKALSAGQIVKRVMPSVVLVVTQDDKGEDIAQGSGFVYRRGLVATNLHVFKRASRAFVRLAGGSVNYKVTEVVGIDMKHDVCVVRIEDQSIAPLTLNTSSKPSIGDEVFTFGNPRGLEGTVSKGIVSGLRSDEGLVQIDASISSGSSGGPVVNDAAQVIGIAVSSLLGGQNLNFAIEAKYLGSLPLSHKQEVLFAGTFSVRDREEDGLKGPVKEVTESWARWGLEEGEFVEGKARIYSKTLYDIDGNMTDRTIIFEDGTIGYRTQNFYDDNGFLRKRIFDQQNKPTEVTNYTVAEAITEKVRYRTFSNVVVNPPRSSDDLLRLKYDRDGNEVERVYSSSDDYMPSGYERRQVNKYDPSGFLIETRSFRDQPAKNYSRAEMYFRFTYQTDLRGNWTRKLEEGASLLPPVQSRLSRFSTFHRKVVYF